MAHKQEASRELPEARAGETDGDFLLGAWDGGE